MTSAWEAVMVSFTSVEFLAKDSQGLVRFERLLTPTRVPASGVASPGPAPAGRREPSISRSEGPLKGPSSLI